MIRTTPASWLKSRCADGVSHIRKVVVYHSRGWKGRVSVKLLHRRRVAIQFSPTANGRDDALL